LIQIKAFSFFNSPRKVACDAIAASPTNRYSAPSLPMKTKFPYSASLFALNDKRVPRTVI